MNNDILVSINYNTFNARKYVREALDSFLMQKTNFKYEILVHDDCSTDGTIDILREYENKYPDIIDVMYEEENQYKKGIKLYSQNDTRARGKYVAYCDGDDFWVDENKLQIQVDFLESHPDYSMCIHSGYNTNEDGSYKPNLFRRFIGDKEVSIKEIVTSWVAPTCSILYRKSMRDDIIIPFGKRCKNGDMPILMYMALKGKVWYIDKPMGAYRNMAEGSDSQKMQSIEGKVTYNKGMLDMLDDFNAYTNGIYDDIVKEAQLRYEYHYYLYTNNPLYKNQKYNSIRLIDKKEKISEFLIKYIPNYQMIWDFYRKLKGK